MATILVVEDVEDVSEVVCNYLKLDSHEVKAVSSIKEMYDELEKRCFDVIVLDLLLPDGDAMDEIPSIRLYCPNTFILVLTALREDRDKILGLEMGADDYVTKPFNPRELVARVRAILRRRGEPQKELVYKDIKLNLQQRTLIVGEDLVQLSPKEFDLLAVFLENPKRVYTRDELLDLVWRGEEKNDRLIDVYISSLRKKIGKERLVTIRGVGYKLA